MDVRQEVLKARAWIEANPTKRKTARGMMKFLNAWLDRANDRPGDKDRRGVGRPFGAGYVLSAPDPPWPSMELRKQWAQEARDQGINEHHVIGRYIAEKIMAGQGGAA